MPKIKRLLQGIARRYCKECGKKTWHTALEYKEVIRVVNKNAGVLLKRRRYGCIIKAPVYYRSRYGVYRCDDCGRVINAALSSKRLSSDMARKSGLEKVHDIIYRRIMNDTHNR